MEQSFKITNDLIFQRIFGKVGNENITKGFLEKILGINIESLTLDTNKRLIGNKPDDKIGRVDVKAKLHDGTKVIIEMQVVRYKFMTERLLYYWAQTYISDLKKGEEYNKLNKTIAILIAVEDLEETKGIKEYHTEWEIRERKHPEKTFSKDLEIHVIELNKFNEGQNEGADANWIRFIKARGTNELKKISKLDQEIQEAIKELDKIEGDPNLKDLYDAMEYEIREKASYIAMGRIEGKEEGEKLRKSRR